MQNLAVLATSTISYSFGCLDSPATEFGGFNSAEKTPPPPPPRRFSPHVTFPRLAESWFEIHLHRRLQECGTAGAIILLVLLQ